MREYKQPVTTTFSIVLNDGLNSLQVDVPIAFAAKEEIATKDEETAEGAPAANGTDTTTASNPSPAGPAPDNNRASSAADPNNSEPAFVPTFDFAAVPERKAQNAPIEVAPPVVDRITRENPQIVSISVSN